MEQPWREQNEAELVQKAKEQSREAKTQKPTNVGGTKLIIKRTKSVKES
uniref:Uncharacterized protein n=1 Tax=Rhizophora mucronata TaxID=61149 RepID=A0A2P2Q635_RHIMU